MPIKQLFVAAALLAGSVAQAQAYTLFDNLSNGAGSGYTTFDNGQLFQSFSNGASSSILTDLTLSLFVPNGDNGGSVVITMLPDDGDGLPDFGVSPLISTYLSDGAISLLVDGVYHLSTSIALDASQRYWIGIADAFDGITGVASSVLWQSANDTNGVGVAGEFMVTDGSVLSVGTGVDAFGVPDGTGQPYVMEVLVPEPATLGILGLSLLGLGWARRRAAAA